jgi:hypothetical protein
METTQQPVIRRNRMNQGQGLAEYSLIISLVALVCLSILAVLGRGTKNTIYKVTCAAGSTDSQCGCINEKLSVTSTFPNGCSGTSLLVTVTSSCSGTTLTVGGTNYSNPAAVNWTPSPNCPTGATSFALKSTQPNGTVNNYTASRP